MVVAALHPHEDLRLTDFRCREIPDSLAAKHHGIGKSAASIAHEISTPLEAIAAPADVLRLVLKCKGSGRAAGPARLLEKVQKIEETAIRVSEVPRLMQGLLGSRRGRRTETLSLGTTACECLTVRGERFRSRRIPLKREIVPSRVVHCVPSDMNHVPAHLLNNAAEAALDMEELWVNELADTASEGRITELWVIASGSGVSEDFAAAMMHPFVTAKSRSRHVGVGLSPASSTCELLGGSLRHENHEGHTSYVLKLPRAHAIRGRGAHAA